jgi:hypothetical protein
MKNNYFKNVLLESFRIKKFLPILLVNILKYFVLVLLIVLGSFLIVETFKSLQPLLNIVDSVKSIGYLSTDLSSQFQQNRSLYDIFMIKLSFLLLITTILFTAIFSVFEYLILKISKNKSYKTIKLLYYNIPLGIILVIISILVTELINNMPAMLIILYILLVLFYYLFKINLIYLTDKNFRVNIYRIFKGLINPRNIIGYILFIVMNIMCLIFVVALSRIFQIYMVPIYILLYFITEIWFIHYLLESRLCSKI